MKNQKRTGRRTAAGEKLKRKVVGTGAGFGENAARENLRSETHSGPSLHEARAV